MSSLSAVRNPLPAGWGLDEGVGCCLVFQLALRSGGVLRQGESWLLWAALALSLSAGECVCTTQTRSPDNKPAFVLLWPPPPPPPPLPPLPPLLLLLNCNWMHSRKQVAWKGADVSRRRGDGLLNASIKIG